MNIGFQITIQSKLSPRQLVQLGNFPASFEQPGQTSICAIGLDQAGLHGLINRCRDMGLSLVSVTPLKQIETSGATHLKGK